MLTTYLECRWISLSVSEYVVKCTILSRVESRVTCMTRSSLVDQDDWASFFVRGALLWNDLPLTAWRWEHNILSKFAGSFSISKKINKLTLMYQFDNQVIKIFILKLYFFTAFYAFFSSVYFDFA
jgi:hypothetical protein